ncbi:FecCD family ABC transporter permease [Vibrio tritonius]|uniref:FecCD family ABC transporter permease n=1 Tax=Vibrio tritonius TaxID=1435069 RepID=UPI000839588B|nr:iron ABC transporter permease [Vibrio tritonius]
MLTKQFTLRLGNAVHLPFSHRFLKVSLCLIITIFGSALLALLQGTADISLNQLAAAFFNSTSPLNSHNIDIDKLLELRIPRIVIALLGGAMLAASGYLLQMSSNNPLADAGLLGISQGTSAVILFSGVVMAVPPLLLPFLGLAGGLIVGFTVLSLALYVRAPNGLILIGLAMSITLGATIELVMVSGNITQYARYIAWSHGSLASVSHADMARLMAWALGLLTPLLLCSRQIAPLQLGDNQAAALGVNPLRIKMGLILLAIALVAPVISITGPISFIGLVAAHVARRLVKSGPGETLIVTMLSGALALLLADLIGRTLFLPLVIPAGLLLSVIGVVGFLIIARMTKRQRRSS